MPAAVEPHAEPPAGTGLEDSMLQVRGPMLLAAMLLLAVPFRSSSLDWNVSWTQTQTPTIYTDVEAVRWLGGDFYLDTFFEYSDYSVSPYSLIGWMYFDGERWSAPIPLAEEPGGLYSDVQATAADGREDVVWLSGDGPVRHMWIDPVDGYWHGPETLDFGPVYGHMAMSSWEDWGLDLFYGVTDSSGRYLKHRALAYDACDDTSCAWSNEDDYGPYPFHLYLNAAYVAGLVYGWGNVFHSDTYQCTLGMFWWPGDTYWNPSPVTDTGYATDCRSRPSPTSVNGGYQTVIYVDPDQMLTLYERGGTTALFNVPSFSKPPSAAGSYDGWRVDVFFPTAQTVMNHVEITR
jgi:hypothetical protein